MKDVHGNTIKGAPSPLKLVASTVGFKKLSDRELLVHCLQQLESELISEQNYGQHAWLARRFPSKLKPPVQCEISIDRDNSYSIEGVIKFTHTIFDLTDEMDFRVSVIDRDIDKNHIDGFYNAEETEFPMDRHVRFTMPHWQFSRVITTRVHRMEVLNFINQEGKERTGFDAALSSNGLPPAAKNSSNPFDL